MLKRDFKNSDDYIQSGSLELPKITGQMCDKLGFHNIMRCANDYMLDEMECSMHDTFIHCEEENGI